MFRYINNIDYKIFELIKGFFLEDFTKQMLVIFAMLHLTYN